MVGHHSSGLEVADYGLLACMFPVPHSCSQKPLAEPLWVGPDASTRRCHEGWTGRSMFVHPWLLLFLMGLDAICTDHLGWKFFFRPFAIAEWGFYSLVGWLGFHICRILCWVLAGNRMMQHFAPLLYPLIWVCLNVCSHPGSITASAPPLGLVGVHSDPLLLSHPKGSIRLHLICLHCLLRYANL